MDTQKKGGHMDIRSLQCFRLAYDSGSIGKAAKRAYLSRQGLSQALKTLEAELDRDLFVRLPDGLEPTEFANQLYPKVIELLNNYEEIQALCFPEDLPQEIVRLSVAFGALTSIPLDSLVRNFHQEHPNIRLEVDTIEPLLAEKCVAQGTEDLALIAGRALGDTTTCTSLMQVPLYAAVHKSLLPPKDKFSFYDLKGLTWFGLSENFPVDSAVIELSKAHNLDIDLSFDWHDYHLILEQVQQKKGACVVPENYIRQFCQDGIIALSLEDPRFFWDISVITPAERALPRSTQVVLDWLKEYLHS